jgi:3-oxoadipate enol-lactonase
MPFARIRGQAFHYTDSGGDGPPILFSHGFLMDGDMFAPQVEALKDRYRVLTWDWRGFGQTETDGQHFTVWDQAEDLIALLDHLEIKSAVLGGMSHGGYITMRVPLIAPTRVQAIVLMATSASALTNEQKAAYRLLFTQWIHEGPTEELTELFANLIIGEPRANEIWKAKWKARSKELLLTPAEATVTADDIRSQLGEIWCPAIVIHGVDDAAFPVTLGEELASALPECDPCILVSGGHAANLTHPERVNAEIARFLDGLRVQ